jgi:hypothetical protein
MYQVCNLSANKESSVKAKNVREEDNLVLRGGVPLSNAMAEFNQRVVLRWPIFILNETVSTCRL